MEARGVRAAACEGCWRGAEGLDDGAREEANVGHCGRFVFNSRFCFLFFIFFFSGEIGKLISVSRVGWVSGVDKNFAQS